MHEAFARSLSYTSWFSVMKIPSAVSTLHLLHPRCIHIRSAESTLSQSGNVSDILLNQLCLIGWSYCGAFLPSCQYVRPLIYFQDTRAHALPVILFGCARPLVFAIDLSRKQNICSKLSTKQICILFIKSPCEYVWCVVFHAITSFYSQLTVI